MTDRQQRGARPPLACEVLSGRVVAARASARRDLLEVYDTRPLPASAVVPGLAGSNVADPAALRQAISGAMGAVAGRTRDLVCVIPDAAVRLFLLDFDVLPADAAEAEGVVRFRLRKSLPFDVDRAALSFDSYQDNGAVHVVAAVTPASVLAEYESAFREAGYQPGFVLPSMLAALGPVEPDAPTLVAKVDPTTISLAILDRRRLRLLRTLENTTGQGIEEARLADEVYPLLVFYQDTYGAPVEHVLVAGIGSLERFGNALHPHTSARIEPLVTGRYLGASLGGDLRRDALAGVVGALIS